MTGEERPSVTISQRGQVGYNIQRKNNILLLEGKKNVTICSNCMVAFEIRVPTGLVAQIVTSNGPIEVTGGIKGLEASTSNGYILTRDTGRANLSLRTSNGRIEVYNATGQIRVNTSNGHVRLEGVVFPTGSSSWVRTSNGTITVRAIDMADGMEIRGRTSNGRVSVNLEGFSVRLERNTFEARRAGDGEAQLELETSNGAITVQ